MTFIAILLICLALVCLGMAIRREGSGSWGLSGLPWILIAALILTLAGCVLVLSLP